jgi:parallel beta-helix repeat protein
MPIFLGIIPARGNTYYFSAGNGDDTRSPAQAQQAGTPWRSLKKLNEAFGQLKPGDSLLLKRGDIFYGSIVANQSGTAGNPIYIGAYGQGNDPVISGFHRLDGWKNIGQNIWQAACPECGLRVNMVIINDKVQPMGRYPATGYLTIESHSANTSITGDNLSTDWTGGDVIIRKNRFVIDHATIVSQQGNTITYKGASYYQPTDKFGYFIQNNIKTLKSDGDWYYDPNAHVINMYFNGNPQPNIMASSVDPLVDIKGRSYLVFKGLSFLGSNGNGFSLADAANIVISYCRIFFAGLDGIDGTHANNLTIDHVAIDYSNDCGILLNGSGSQITDCAIRHSGTIPGMGRGEHSYIGVQIDGNNNSVQYSTIDTSGYCGVLFWHSNGTTIKNNKIDYFCFLEDDGGGVYTWSGDIDSATVRNAGVISGNIILNGVTAPDGTDKAHAAIANGIYLDENTSGIEVSNNAIAHCTSGIFLQDAHEVTVKGNTVYDNNAQIEIRHALDKGTLRNNDIAGNTAVAAKSGQVVLLISAGVTSGVGGNVAAFAGVHDNHYATGSGGTFYRLVTRQNNQNLQDKGGLGDWQSKYGKDANSVQATPSGGIRFEYNDSKSVKSVSLDGSYKDPSGKTFQGQVDLEPYSSEILIKQ